jgi:hypothetical protein
MLLIYKNIIAAVISIALQFRIINHGVPQLNPENFQSKNGQRNGVGRNFLECVGMSTNMCISYAHKYVGIFPMMRNIIRIVAANTNML